MFFKNTLILPALVFSLFSCQQIPNQVTDKISSSSMPENVEGNEISKSSVENDKHQIQIPNTIVQELTKPYTGANLVKDKLETGVRFTLTKIDENNQGTVADSINLEYDVKSLENIKTPIVLESDWLKPGVKYSLKIDYFSKNMNCNSMAASDSESVFPENKIVEAKKGNSISNNNNSLELDFGDFSLVPFRQPIHGKVTFSDNSPASNVNVQIEAGNQIFDVKTNGMGYYVSPPDPSNNSEITISIKALSENAQFKTYTAKVVPDLEIRNQCNEALSKHDIVLESAS